MPEQKDHFDRWDRIEKMGHEAFGRSPMAEAIRTKETSATDDLLRELIDEVRGLREDLRYHEIRTGKRLIGS